MEAERFDDDAPPNVIYELTHSEQVKVGDVTYPASLPFVSGSSVGLTGL